MTVPDAHRFVKLKNRHVACFSGLLSKTLDLYFCMALDACFKYVDNYQLIFSKGKTKPRGVASFTRSEAKG